MLIHLQGLRPDSRTVCSNLPPTPTKLPSKKLLKIEIRKSTTVLLSGFGRPHLMNFPLVCTGQTPFLLDCGRNLWTALNHYLFLAC